MSSEKSTCAVLFGVIGAATAVTFCVIGSAYGITMGTAGITSSGISRSAMITKLLLTVVMSGVITIYGCVMAFMIVDQFQSTNYTLFNGYMHLGVGIAVGLSGLATAIGLGNITDLKVRGTTHQLHMYNRMMFNMTYIAFLGIYSVTVGTFMKMSKENPNYYIYLGVIGAATTIVFITILFACGIATRPVGITPLSNKVPDVMKLLLPVVISGIITICSCAIVHMILRQLQSTNYSLYNDFLHLGAGITVGFSGLTNAIGLGIIGDVGVDGTNFQSRIGITGMVLIMIFADVFGTYGFIGTFCMYAK